MNEPIYKPKFEKIDTREKPDYEQLLKEFEEGNRRMKYLKKLIAEIQRKLK